jgi:hypothetical protein
LSLNFNFVFPQVKFQIAQAMVTALGGNVLVNAGSKDAFVKKLTAQTQLVQRMDSVPKGFVFAKKDGLVKTVRRKTKLLFLAYLPARTTANLIHTVRNAFVSQSSAVMIARWNFAI